tara:strand:+ start:834 stop:1568 length:735 start_codon:yes stop_codon:yes gene_type:complete
MACSAGPNVVQDGIALSVDAGNTKSYPESGTTLFDQIESNDMTLYNSPTFTPQYNGFFAMDGSNDNIGYTSNIDSVTNFAKTQNYSIEFWFKNKNTASDGEKHLIDLYDAPYGYPYTFRNTSNADGANEMNVIVYGGDVRVSNFTCKRNNWNHILFSADWETGGTAGGNMYVNGEFATDVNLATSGSISLNPSSNWRICARSSAIVSTSKAMHCDFAVCRTYRKALSAVEAKRNFLALKGRFEL